jgi:hypothetical protein
MRVAAMQAMMTTAAAARPKDVISDSPHVKIDSIESGQV